MLHLFRESGFNGHQREKPLYKGIWAWHTEDKWDNPENQVGFPYVLENCYPLLTGGFRGILFSFFAVCLYLHLPNWLDNTRYYWNLSAPRNWRFYAICTTDAHEGASDLMTVTWSGQVIGWQVSPVTWSGQVIGWQWHDLGKWLDDRSHPWHDLSKWLDDSAMIWASDWMTGLTRDMICYCCDIRSRICRSAVWWLQVSRVAVNRPLQMCCHSVDHYGLLCQNDFLYGIWDGIWDLE